jgi:hypothetical protein
MIPLPQVLSQISILGAKSGNWVSEIQWFVDLKTLEKANLRQYLRERPIFPLLVEAVSCLCTGETPDLRWITQHEPLPTPFTS